MNNRSAMLLLTVFATLLDGCTTLDPYHRLQAAIRSHSIDQAQTLLKANSHRISATDALIVAAQEGDVASVDRFLLQGALINQRNAEGETALTVAARQRNPQMVEHLVQRGADPTGRDGFDKAPFDYVIKWNPWDATLVEQKEIIAQYLTDIANGKKPVMTDIAQALAERRAHAWDLSPFGDSPAKLEDKIRVVDLHSAIIR